MSGLSNKMKDNVFYIVSFVLFIVGIILSILGFVKKVPKSTGKNGKEIKKADSVKRTYFLFALLCVGFGIPGVFSFVFMRKSDDYYESNQPKQTKQ